MARINGVGATKLARYGSIFLQIITGTAPEHMHPSRRKLAGKDSGALYDQLLVAQAALTRGADGTDKPLSCSASLLARVAGLQSPDATTLARLLGDRRSERFGPAFLHVLRAA